jgi:hypothetical protein
MVLDGFLDIFSQRAPDRLLSILLIGGSERREVPPDCSTSTSGGAHFAKGARSMTKEERSRELRGHLQERMWVE